MYFTTVLLAAISGVSAVSIHKARDCAKIFPDESTFSVAKVDNVNVETALTNFFVGPTTAGPCSLVADIRADLPGEVSADPATVRIDVLNGSTVVGSLTVTQGQRTSQTINSFACQLAHEFSYRVADEFADASVSFDLSPESGLYLTVGSC